MRGNPITAEKAVSIVALSASAAWALWCLSDLSFSFYLWLYSDSYRPAVALVDSVQYSKSSKSSSYRATVKINSKIKLISVTGFKIFNQGFIKKGSGDMYKGVTLEVLVSDIATPNALFTNRSVDVIPGDTNLSNRGIDVFMKVATGFSPLVLCALRMMISRRPKQIKSTLFLRR
jgi:hypothetical protein